MIAYCFFCLLSEGSVFGGVVGSLFLSLLLRQKTLRWVGFGFQHSFVLFSIYSKAAQVLLSCWASSVSTKYLLQLSCL